MGTTAPKLTAADALDLARAFREVSTSIGDYLYKNWTVMSTSDRDKLRSLEVTLLNVATDLVTQAVGIVLDEGQGNLKALTDATKIAKKAIAKIDSVKKAIRIVTSLIGLAAAIPTGNIDSIYAALKSVNESVA